jgi:hypothetical protein
MVTEGSCSSTLAVPVFQLPLLIVFPGPCQVCDAAECEVGSLSLPGASLTLSSAARNASNALSVLEPAFGRYGWIWAFLPPSWFQLVYVPL